MQLLIIFFILLGFPALEIIVLFRVADSIGWWLLPWLILSAAAGWTLIQEERLAMFGRLFSSLQSGQPLGFAMLDSLRTLFAGILLIFPGVISDGLAVILLLLPRARKPGPPPRDSGEDVIIEGEWQREDDPRLK
ncbi:MAG: FxsA family protein [Sulfuricella sp.]|jgi:UPF0716 protein FxsA